jgi:hypothetical protein
MRPFPVKVFAELDDVVVICWLLEQLTTKSKHKQNKERNLVI